MAMWTERHPGTLVPITLAAAPLLWPAIWNGYPLVFSDTGTYLSQAIEHYIGWDRPIFYSLLLLPLHMTITTWPAIIAQALLVTYLLHLVRRTLLPGTSVWWLLPLTCTMAIGSALPWFASQLMPDVFTGTLVLGLALLLFVPEQLSRWERDWLVAFTTLAIAVHQSHVLLALGLLLVLLPLRGWLGAANPLGRSGSLRAVAPVALAVIALISVNLAVFGRASVAPFGNVFLLTRIVYDGPGMTVLRRDCPASGWRLCPYIDHLPEISDDFLWREDGPVVRAGGAKLIAAEADAIIAAALRADPAGELRAFTANSIQQLSQFATGDGLAPWPATVTPRIERDFPQFEAATYAASRQTIDGVTVPTGLQALHAVLALIGVTGCCALLLAAPRGQRHVTGFAAATLLALIGNAAITGGLSGPHDRYQSRIMWLPPLIALAGAAVSVRSAARPAISR